MVKQAAQILSPDENGLAQAAEYLRAGQCVAFPTETVYGLGADARDGQAVARIYEAKSRPSFNPLIVHVHDVQAAKRYVRWNDMAERLAQAFWPGALSLVLPLSDNHGLSELVTAGLDTVALRVPAHPVAQQLLDIFDGPIAAPSANPSGRISPTCAGHVIDGLGDRIAGIVDGGPCNVGVESTIVQVSSPPRLLRPGGIASVNIETVLECPLASPEAEKITAPGQIASHYAPNAEMRLNAHSADHGEIHLGFGDIAGDLTLSASGNLVEAAANLFGHLHQLDETGRPIAVAPIPMTGLGQAINDRLNRAAAPRSGMPSRS
ncbi:MAG: L-threonylcarbamoyladenylate synthase [Paracoccaceae bacterium]